MLASIVGWIAMGFGPADPGSGVDIDISLGQGIVGGATGAFFTTLIVGAILIAVAPTFTRSMVDSVRDEPVESFLYGLLSLVLLVIVIVALVLTIVGILVVIPLVVVAVVLWAVGSAIGFLAIANQFVGLEDGWSVPLLLAAGLSGGAALTGIGGLISFFIGAVGFGAVLRHFL